MHPNSTKVRKCMSRNTLDFSTYCIGSLAEALRLNQTDVYRRLRTSGILRDYIVDFYEVAHTYSKAYIVEDLIALMKERGVL